MNDALRQAATVDPQWARREARRQFILKATVAGTLLALALGTVAFVLGFHNAERITHVEHSACQEDAASYECQHTKLEAEKAANLQTTCAPFFKAGYPCPKPGSTADERQNRRQEQAGSGEAQALGNGGGGPPGAGGGQQSAPGKGGGASPPAPGKGGSGGAPAPGQGGGGGQGPGASGPTESGAPAEQPASSPPPAKGVVPAVTEAVEGAVKEAGNAVNEVVEGVGAKGCGLLGGC